MMALAKGTPPSTRLTLIGARVGSAVAESLCAAALTGKLSPQVLGEAIVSSNSVRSHVQTEVLRLVAVRISMQCPTRLEWLVHLVMEYLSSQSGAGAISALGRRTILYHVASFGLRGTVASAVAAAAVQASMQSCHVVTSRVIGPRANRISLAQYRYNLVSTTASAMGTILGGGIGAAIGTAAMPGFGTALGSVICSLCGGMLPSYWRDSRGPDDRRRRHLKELAAAPPMQMRDGPWDFVEFYNPTDVEEDSYVVLQAHPSSAVSLSSSVTSLEGTTADCEDSHSASAPVSMRSSLHFTRDTTMPAESAEWTEKSATTRLGGVLEQLVVREWAEVDERVDTYGEEELVLIFSMPAH